MDYQWYPGHMTKARRMMQGNIKLIDLVIELVDARAPMSSRNPDIDDLAKRKSKIDSAQQVGSCQRALERCLGSSF